MNNLRSILVKLIIKEREKNDNVMLEFMRNDEGIPWYFNYNEIEQQKDMYTDIDPYKLLTYSVRGWNFEEFDLVKWDFIGADISCCIFKKCNILNLDPQLVYCKSLVGCYFEEFDLNNWDFVDVDIEEAVFKNCNMERTNLHKAKSLNTAEFIDCKLPLWFKINNYKLINSK